MQAFEKDPSSETDRLWPACSKLGGVRKGCLGKGASIQSRVVVCNKPLCNGGRSQPRAVSSGACFGISLQKHPNSTIQRRTPLAHEPGLLVWFGECNAVFLRIVRVYILANKTHHGSHELPSALREVGPC